MLQETGNSIRRIAFIGNYTPRKCGIATFTTDLAEAVANRFPETTCFALAINDREEGYDYLPRVRFELPEGDLISYQRAADYLNVNQVDVVSLQHEYGIFGGPAGSHILSLLRDIRMPVVTTLHTILDHPDPDQYKVMRELADLSNRLVVMSHRGVDFLKDIYHIPEEKIEYIPHGIPDVPFVDPNFYKDHFGVEGKTVILTFGLLSPNKGIEDVISALPRITERYPDVIYIVLGATHPNILKTDGEKYRNSLRSLARRLGMSEHVIFDNRFVTHEELVEYIGAADIYITPYLNKEQITSGTLAYTVGAGKSVISTPYWYAEELLSEERGSIVPFKDPAAIAEQVIYLLENEAVRHATRKRAYLYGREMIWPKVAERYLETFERARNEPITRSQTIFTAEKSEAHSHELPSLNLLHLSQMTDSTGMLQHAIFSLPNYNEGYTTDDNARALMVGILLEQLGEEWFTGAEEFNHRYLGFLWHAYNQEQGRFRNFMAYDRHWLEDVGSEDSHGRALWAAGMAAGRSNHSGLRSVGSTLFNWGLMKALELNSPRSWAFCLLGIDEYLKQFSGDRFATTVGLELAERLMDLYISIDSPDWHWFENTVTYSNASLSHALLTVGEWADRKDMIDVGLTSLRWLQALQKSEEGFFSPIGSHGFYTRGGEKANFDQQPVEAQTMIFACLRAYRITGDESWFREARKCFDWYLGANSSGRPLYDPTTGGCRDGIHPDRINQNQGAESTLSFYLSLLELRLSERITQTSRAEQPSAANLLSIRAALDTD
jgi:glycosyltransferase involved in cell wall biosynthesis